ncbi:hypothetical protein GGTG_10152 [Gaeumannomyces tritici R3-111a-1]|uniref:Uncharacterized protein n=1 Tax=Gaeumannomyces tritici (strain R3-111a-1) TaxID=644352 RepID=J3P9H1_GAET3|nr:hypothetical protein GGTG_10152 [Gaeumannomyces tritici R3-111a-1]EJT73307.1 hypothetical protein GGTG_10152 [Gaeumannomyces tritici R3-111a-1]
MEAKHHPRTPADDRLTTAWGPPAPSPPAPAEGATAPANLSQNQQVCVFLPQALKHATSRAAGGGQANHESSTRLTTTLNVREPPLPNVDKMWITQ